MVHKEQHDAVGLAFGQGANRGLNRGDLSLLPVLVDHDARGIKRESATDLFGVFSEYHARPANFRLPRNFEKVLQEGLPARA
jgi:hypothetical protein